MADADPVGVIAEKCTRCGACRNGCAFLKQYGLPGDAAATELAGEPSGVDPFACSLCDLCAAMCPEKLFPAGLFLEMRRRAIAENRGRLAPYRRLRTYEWMGNSRLFSYYGLPDQCRTVFFPGCAMSGARPETTWRMYRQIAERRPNLGIVMDCCIKPSHDLGDDGRFSARFGRVMDRLSRGGVDEIITACPGCFDMFRKYSGKLSVQSVWEVMPPPRVAAVPGTSHPRVRVHDPCTARFLPRLHERIRTHVAGLRLEIIETPQSGRLAACCGEGGAVSHAFPHMADAWRQSAAGRSGGDPVVTYCIGCTGYLAAAGMKTVFLGDLLANPASTEMALCGSAGTTWKFPGWTYLNRIRLKRRFCRFIQALSNIQAN